MKNIIQEFNKDKISFKHEYYDSIQNYENIKPCSDIDDKDLFYLYLKKQIDDCKAFADSRKFIISFILSVYMIVMSIFSIILNSTSIEKYRFSVSATVLLVIYSVLIVYFTIQYDNNKKLLIQCIETINIIDYYKTK